ncbi:hypothetical protein [Pseudozobellia sp. WGM2]|uniref:hypothetical protein n=1 Tax=Pseudozobellia sp. WGM2 TaxID=2787625 RepID=UPI001AE04569|nr:hypothetical protein [Pseudozobellia sp. WGM2]
MFWKSKTKLPAEKSITYIQHNIFFIERLIGTENFTSFPLINPNEFLLDFDGTKEGALLLFKKIIAVLGLEEIAFKLDFHWEKPVKSKLHEGIIDLASLYQKEKLTLGTYKAEKEKYIVSIEMSLLKNAHILVYTMAHELSHYILLTQKKLFYNDEKLTDLMTMVYGFGNFWLNSQNWKANSLDHTMGYFTKEDGAYAMAFLLNYRNVPITALHGLDKSAHKLLNDYGQAIEKSDVKAMGDKNHFTDAEINTRLTAPLIDYLCDILNDELLDYSYTDGVLAHIMLYNDYVKKGKGKLFSKRRTDVITAINNEIHKYIDLTLEEQTLVNGAFKIFDLYGNKPLSESSFNDIKVTWKQNLESRNEMLEEILEHIEITKKLDPQLMHPLRKELCHKLIPYLEMKIVDEYGAEYLQPSLNKSKGLYANQ